MGIVVVDICSANIINKIDVEGILENEFPEVAVISTSCLSFCGLCAKTAFAQVNGKLIHGKTIDQCLDNIRKAIKKELAIYYT